MSKYFTHDCETCEYIGSVDSLMGKYDLYVCKNEFFHRVSIIARYGNDGPNYVSSPVSNLRMTNDTPEMLMLKTAWVMYQSKDKKDNVQSWCNFVNHDMMFREFFDVKKNYKK